jgi:hypothetical protein
MFIINYQQKSAISRQLSAISREKLKFQTFKS